MDNKAELDTQLIINTAKIWASATVKLYQRDSRTLTESETKIALDVGVANPEKIRVIEIKHIPEPEINMLVELRMQNGFRFSHTAGLSLGYLVFIKNGLKSDHLLAHEFRHVCQFEEIGSQEKMIERYLQEIIKFGYQNAPLEIDAIKASLIYA